MEYFKRISWEMSNKWFIRFFAGNTSGKKLLGRAAKRPIKLVAHNYCKFTFLSSWNWWEKSARVKALDASVPPAVD